MDLFTPAVDIERLHPNFQRVLSFARRGERAVVQQWAEHFPDRDNKFVKEFQTTFNSSFWELYLHSLFKSYEFIFDWSHNRPDFMLSNGHVNFVVEATTANAAVGDIPEWDKTESVSEKVLNKRFGELNKTAIIRLSNGIHGKTNKYRDYYTHLNHVAGKPYVVAVAPFEQPDFQFQYDRPMRALLYDDYVDEEIFFKDPSAYPNGPPSIRLGYVEKANGAEVELGIFNDSSMSEISAVLFSCVATWGKAVAMSSVAELGFVNSLWGVDGPPGDERRTACIGVPSETISDGLQVFHNPNASKPLDPSVFRRVGVVQHYWDNGQYVQEHYSSALRFRQTTTIGLSPPQE